MNGRFILLPWLMAACFVVLVSAGAERERILNPANASTRPAATVEERNRTNESGPAVRSEMPASMLPKMAEGAAPLFNLDWYSVNGGGATAVSSASYKMGMSAGQSVAGFASGTAYQLGVGFWYGASGGGGACLIAMTGDVNLSMSLTSSDIIYLVNFVFKGQAAPLPCEASGDVNCSGSVTSADIIFLVNHVFKGQGPPCDVCTLIPGMWSCP